MKDLQDLPLSPPDEVDVTEFVDNYADEKLKEPVTEDDILEFGEWLQTAGDDFDTIRRILLLVLNDENPDPQAAGEWIIGMMKAYRRGKAEEEALVALYECEKDDGELHYYDD